MQEKSLQVAADVGMDVTLVDDMLFESEDEDNSSKGKTPSFIAICDRSEVRTYDSLNHLWTDSNLGIIRHKN